MIPENLTECPYYLFISSGQHSHPPPPPTKAPLVVLQEIQDIVKKMQNPDLQIGM